MIDTGLNIIRGVASIAETVAIASGSSKTKDTTKATTSPPPVAGSASTSSRTQAGEMTLEKLLRHKIADCSPIENSELGSLNQEKSQHYALIYDNQESFISYLNKKCVNTTLNNTDDLDTHVDDFLLEKALCESLPEDNKKTREFSDIMKNIEVIDEKAYFAVKPDIHPAGRIKSPFCTDVLSVEKQGIHNSNTDCWINVPLISLRDIYHSLDEEGKKALLAKINENTTSTSSGTSSTKTNSPLAAFLEGKYDATTPAAAQLLRLDVLRILNHYNDPKTGNVLSDKTLEKCINSINPEGKSTGQLDYRDMFRYLSKSLNIEDKVEHKTLICEKDTSHPLKLTNIVAIANNDPPTASNLKDCYAFELNRSDDSGGSSSSTTGINKISIEGLTDNLDLHDNNYMPASIICHTTDGINSGHFINIFSRKDSDNNLKWYATSNEKTEAIDLEKAMTEDNKKGNLSISFGAEDPSSSSGSTAVDTTTWKQFIALKAVHVTYVKDTAA